MSRVPRTRCLLLAATAALAVAGCGDSGAQTTATTPPTTTAPAKTAVQGPQLGPAFGSMDDLPGVLKSAPPWPANQAKLQLRLRAIGLPALSAEGELVHIHQHLDVYVDGDKIEVPADIGIDPSQAFISPLHTHEPPDGIMHIESPTASSFSLGQFFAVWGVRLSPTCIGGKCASARKLLRAWVNGEPIGSDPTRLVLESHQEIVVAYGTPAQMPKPVPTSFSFPAGL